MAPLRIPLALALAALAAAPAAAHKHAARRPGSASSATSLISKPDFRHRLRVCNAYTSHDPIHVQRKDSTTISNLTTSPLSYKACQDFPMQLHVGDSIWFRMNKKPLGVFSVTTLPRRDALLLLVTRRRSPESSTLAFSSHVFASLLNAQIAVLDAYSGHSSEGRIVIRDSDGAETGSRDNDTRVESLSYNTVVAINPGKYECALLGSSHTHNKPKPLVGLNRENYVLLRVGEDDNPAFPQELVVFPGPLGRGGRAGCSALVLLGLLGVLHLSGAL